jgi:hypothetical protein
MTDMPERIHAWTWNGRRYAGQWEASSPRSRDVEYIRADKVSALVDAARLFTWSYVHESDKIIDAFYAAETALAALDAKP